MSRHDVYFNLRKNVFSIRRKGRIVAHATSVRMGDATFCVGEKGRQRVLREKQKNVHAYIKGELLSIPGEYAKQATYNPYKYTTFVDLSTGTALIGTYNIQLRVINDKPVVTYEEV